MKDDPNITDPSRATLTSALRDQLQALRTQQEQLFAEMHERQQRYQGLARSVWRVQEHERRALARELHDGVGQNLTALKYLLERRDPESIERASDLCARTLDEVRALAKSLRPPLLDDLGLPAALEALARTMADSGGFRISVDLKCAVADDDLATLIYRLAQEALTNIVKHARAQHVMLRLAIRGDAAHLIVADDGCGMATTAAAGSGLGGMRERVALFGGQLHLTSAPSAGTQLRAVLPLP